MSEYLTPTRSRLATALVAALTWLYRSRADDRGFVYYDKMPRLACRLAQRAHQIAWPGVTTY